MAALPTESPPPPPPPPPIINHNSSDSNLPNGPSTHQTQNAGSGTATTSTNNEGKPWERAWSVDEMRKGATTWSLASDAGLLRYLQEFSHNMISETHKMEQKVDGLVHETKGLSAKVHNTFNDFLMLSNTQFIENRVYDEEETKEEEVPNNESSSQEKEKTREELETEVIPKINEAIASGLSVLESAFSTVEITPEQISDDEDEGNLPENLRPEPILELTDVYAHRKLPTFIGSQEFQKDDLVGLAESSSGESDNEASASDEAKSSEDETSSESESETVSGSSSESKESSTATESDESEDEKIAVQQESVQGESVSDDELFAASGTQKSSQPNQEMDSDESDREVKEKPKKVGAPLDFSAELAAKLGAKMRLSADHDDDDDDDDDDDNDDGESRDWEESGRHDSEQAKDELFSASVDTTTTTTSVVSKSSKRGKSKHKKPKSRTGSRDSGAPAAAAVSSAVNEQDLQRSGKHEENEQDDLFTSSIDTSSSVISKSSRHKHKGKKKKGRSDSQLSSASSKSETSQKETKAISEKSDTNLFGASPEGGLFDEDVSSPFGKKGGMFSGGGGLFDEVDDDDDDEVRASKSDAVGRKASKENQDKGESDESEDDVPVKSKPRTTSSGKKLPAGAVSIFGDHGPFGPVPVHSSGHHVEHNVEKTSPPAKKQENEKSGGGGLFSDDDDLVTSGHSSSVASSKPSVAKKMSKPVDLFGDADDADDDDDSLFGEKPAKKEEPKTRASKKKLPAGAVSIFGASPPPLFSASSTANETAESVVSATSGISDAKNAGTKVGGGGGLFSEDDLTSSFSSEKTAPSVTTPVVPAAVKPGRKTTQISLFDDQDDEEDGDDLFASIAPSKGMASGKTAKVSKSKEPKEEKKNVVSKPTAKRSTISLFDDDDDDDDDDGNVKDGSNIFNTKPVMSSEQNKATAKESKPASKAAVKASGGLFGSEEDLLFTGALKAKPSDPLVMNKKAENKLSTKPTEARSPMLNVDEDEEDDLFAEPRTKPPSTDPLLGNEEQTTGREAVTSAAKQKGPIHLDDEEDLFGESKKKTPTSDPLVADATAPVDTGSKEDTMKSSQNVCDNDNQTEDKEIDEDDGAKIPPGAVPMFGGVNIFAAQTPGKGKRQPPGGGLFGDDEDDLFAATSHPKPIPSAAPRSKPPKKPHVPTPPKTSSSPVSQPPIPVQRSVPVVSSAEKNTNVGKLQKTLAFNPAAMLPGAVPPLKKHENLVEATFDKPVSGKTLESSARNRVRIHAKRRPPTRQARRTAAKESMDDSSLFGSTISSSVPSVPEERLAVEGRKPASLFSDSDDLFSSNSYEAPEKTEQTYSTKSDPFFNTNKTIAAPPASSFCADSVDAVSQEKFKSNVETAKDDVSKIERQKTTTKTATDSPFREKSDDDLFSGSVEDKSSSQKVNVIRDDKDDEDDEDDLFKSSSRPLFSPPPLDFDSEASTSNDFANYIKPKPSNDELLPDNSKLNNDIFSPLPSAARTDEKTMEKEKKKDEQNTTDQNDLDKKDSETRSKEIGAKTSNLVDDLFGDTGSIFDDVPKKPKEKKKKKTTVSKEESIFDEPKGLAADEDVTSVKTTKKTKGKKKVEKKGKSKISIFDEDSPSIFDDPLNATSSK